MRLLLYLWLMMGVELVYCQNMQLLNYRASNGVDYTPGMMIHLGQGSAQNKDFVYVDSNYLGANDKTNLPANYGGQYMEVRKIRQSGTKKQGYKIYLICTTGPKNYWVDIEAAIKAGEVLAE